MGCRRPSSKDCWARGFSNWWWEKLTVFVITICMEAWDPEVWKVSYLWSKLLSHAARPCWSTYCLNLTREILDQIKLSQELFLCVLPLACRIGVAYGPHVSPQLVQNTLVIDDWWFVLPAACMWPSARQLTWYRQHFHLASLIDPAPACRKTTWFRREKTAGGRPPVSPCVEASNFRVKKPQPQLYLDGEIRSFTIRIVVLGWWGGCARGGR